MSFLSPLFLLAAAAVAVPLFLHLFHRHDSRRQVFPALRYLLRTEREHARSIRLRQLLLLLVRVCVILLLVAAGARPFLRGGGGAHDPTALVIVLDNSMSSGRVVGEERVLDVLKARARETLAAARPEDRIWVVRAGEPWDVALPGGADAALARVDSTVPSAARGDLSAAVARARGLVEAAELPGAEIHLLSDLQRSAFGPGAGGPPAADVPVVVYAAPPAERPNHFIRDLVVGGGLPPLAGQRTEVAVRLDAAGRQPEDAEPATGGTGAEAEAPLPVRVVTGERIRAAGTGRAGEDVVLPFGPFAGGTVEGYVETDPDALREDDRRWFAFAVRPPVAVRRTGAPHLFLDEALRVLGEAGRTRDAAGGAADVVLAVNGEGLGPRAAPAAVVVPSPDPALLPALNRRLAAAGIPWRYGPPGGRGEATVSSSRVPVDLEGLRVGRRYALRAVAEGGGEVVARLSDGEPFLVSGRSSSGRYVLLAAPLDPGWTELPVSASMVPLLEWAVARGVGTEERRRVLAGEEIPTPPGATAVRDPDGVDHPVEAARTFRGTARTGVYRVLAGDSVLERVAVNAPARESLLEPMPTGELPRVVGPGTVVAPDPDTWAREIFRRRQGPEIWRPLLLAALLLLLVESRLAASGTATPVTRRESPEPTGGVSGEGGTPGGGRGGSDRGRGAPDGRPTRGSGGGPGGPPDRAPAPTR